MSQRSARRCSRTWPTGERGGKHAEKLARAGRHLAATGRHDLTDEQWGRLVLPPRNPGRGGRRADITPAEVSSRLRPGRYSSPSVLSKVNQATPEQIAYPGAAQPLREVWLAVRSSLSTVLESVTLADVARGTLPQAVQILAQRPYPSTDSASP